MQRACWGCSPRPPAPRLLATTTTGRQQQQQQQQMSRLLVAVLERGQEAQDLAQEAREMCNLGDCVASDEFDLDHETKRDLEAARARLAQLEERLERRMREEARLRDALPKRFRKSIGKMLRARMELPAAALVASASGGRGGSGQGRGGRRAPAARGYCNRPVTACSHTRSMRERCASFWPWAASSR